MYCVLSLKDFPLLKNLFVLFSYFSMQNLDCSSNVIFKFIFLICTRLLVSYLFFFCFISFLKPFLLLSWYYTLYFVMWLIFVLYYWYTCLWVCYFIWMHRFFPFLSTLTLVFFILFSTHKKACCYLFYYT